MKSNDFLKKKNLNKEKKHVEKKETHEQAQTSLEETNKLNKLQEDYKKCCTDLEQTSQKIQQLNEEIQQWRIKYEKFAHQLESDFLDKLNKIDASMKKNLNAEKERIHNETQIKIHNEIANIFKNIAEQVLNTSQSALVLPEQASNETRNYARGFQMLIDNLMKVMENKGLSIIYPKVNDPFDPKIHNAISIVNQPDAPEEGVIIEVLTPQYKLNEKIISYSKVKVAIKGKN